MVKKLKVMDVELNHFSLRESFLIIEKYMKDSHMSTVRLVTMEQLAMAGQDGDVKESLTDTDLCIIEDEAILQAAGASPDPFGQDVDAHRFFEELLRRMVVLNKSVYLAGYDPDKVSAFKEYLSREYKHLNIIGYGVVSDDSQENENLINEINTVLPDVVLSILKSPVQDRFLNSHKDQIYTKVWVGLGSDESYAKSDGFFKRIWRKKIESRIFHYQVERYRTQKMREESKREMMEKNRMDHKDKESCDDKP